MLLSLQWLQRYVDLSGIEPARIADELTLGTAEVEGIAETGEALGEIVVGKVVACAPHPNADKLSLCRVQAGPGEFLSIVCGAPNVAAGQSIALCRAGARVPIDGKKLKKTKIRGEASEGMICSERELGLSDEHQGILVLDTDAEAGTPLTDVLPLRDTLIEIDNKSITHRPDLWGHYGFARELAAHYGRELRPFLDREPAIPSDGMRVPIDIAPSNGLCARYAGIVFEGVTVGPSPAWLRYLLIAIGQRPINNVVDLTNFVLHDLGQPTHAFDLRALRGPAIEVRLARDGESLVTLDGVTRKLTSRDLLICDGEGPVALAGVMGGEGSMVEDATTRVFLESASFDAATVRRTSMRLGLRTDASAHFEKSLDPAWAELAARKFAALLPDVSPGARAAGPLDDPSGWRFAGRSVRLRGERLARVLGVRVDGARVRSYLEPLGFALREVAGNGSAGGTADYDADYDVDVPSWRATKDITIEEDLIEEVGRRHRYDAIEPVAPIAVVAAPEVDPELGTVRKLRTCLAYDCGYSEAYNYSFLPDDLAEQLELTELPYVRVTNAIASHMTRVRRDVLPSLLGSLPQNTRARERVALFEIGKGYRRELAEGAPLPQEVHQGVFALIDRRDGAPPATRVVRGHLDQVLARLARSGLPVRKLSPTEAPHLPWMHPARTAVLHDPDNDFRIVAYAGELHPRTLAALGIELGRDRDGAAAACCIDIRALLATPEHALRYEPPPKFPPQPVDLAFLVAEATTAGELDALCRAAGPKLVRSVELFEVYRGPKLGEGKKSLNFTVTLGSDKRTLSAEDEERYIARVRELAAEAGAELRG